jgi:hypothetical protein
VLATGRCGLYDHWMRQRTDYALADLFGAQFSNTFEDAHHDGVLRNPETGCVLLPGQWGQMLGPNQPACRIPADRMAREVRALLPPTVPEVVSPVPHVGCSWNCLPDGSHLLGLINYGDEPVRGIEIRWPVANRMPARLTAWTANGAAMDLPVHVLNDTSTCVRPPELDVELFLGYS